MPLRRRTTRELPRSKVVYPLGTFLKTELGYFYILSETKRTRLITKRVLDSWSPLRVVETSEAAVEHYRIAFKMKFRNGSLIHNLADGKIYLIENGRRRHITNPDVFERIGAVRNETVSVSLDEIKLHEEGEPLN